MTVMNILCAAWAVVYLVLVAYTFKIMHDDLLEEDEKDDDGSIEK